MATNPSHSSMPFDGPGGSHFSGSCMLRSRQYLARKLTCCSLHIVMFGALLILAASVVFLVKNDSISTDSKETVADQDAAVEKATQNAIWAASTALALAMFCMMCVALLNRALDKKHTLVINSRWIRLLPRIPAIVLIMCLPLMHLTGSEWCGLACIVVYVVFMWETFAGLEKGWMWLEPKDEDK
jgi:ABC-type Fe3+ transport system permease subunit